MLQQLRAAAKTWVASLFIGALAISFAIWGTNDIFRGTTRNTVASVGDIEIGIAEFDREFRNDVRRRARQLGVDLTTEQARQLGFGNVVLDRMISRAALDQKAGELGLTASDATVATEIRAIPSFAGPFGGFDRITMQRALYDAGLTEETFVESMRSDLIRTQLLDAMSDGLETPPGLARTLFEYLNELRTVEYVAVAPEAAGSVPEPTDSELEAFRAQNPAAYSTPEYRQLSYVEIGPAAFSEGTTISDETLEAEYEARKAAYEQPEFREMQQLLFPSKEAAEDAHRRIQAGADFPTIATEMGRTEDDLKLGNLRKEDMHPKLVDAAFAIVEGGVTAPLEGPFGWVILRTVKVTPSVSKSFDEVRDALKKELVDEQAAESVIDLANAFEDARAGGATLSEAAERLGLTARRVAAVDEAGNTPEGVKAGVPEAAMFLEQAFAAETGEEGDIFETPDHRYYALKVEGVTPPAIKPLDAVRAALRDAWLKTERTKRLDARVKELAEQANAEHGLAGIARVLGGAPQTSEPLSRNAESDVFSSQLLARLFAETPGTVVSDPAASGEGYVIARVTKLERPDKSVVPPNYAQNGVLIARQIQSDIVASLAAAARSDVGVEIYPTVLSRALGETP